MKIIALESSSQNLGKNFKHLQGKLYGIGFFAYPLGLILKYFVEVSHQLTIEIFTFVIHFVEMC